MKPSEDFATKYPKLAKRILTHGMIHVMQQPRVFKTFVKMGNCSENFAQSMLRGGTAPVLHSYARGYMRNKNGKIDHPKGFVADGNVRDVNIREEICIQAESKLMADGSGAYTRKFEVTVLHECVHIANNVYGKTRRGEAGDAFEKHAYGIPGVRF